MKLLLRLVLLASIALTAAQAQPANDNISSPTDLGSEVPQVLVYNNIGALNIPLFTEMAGVGTFINTGTDDEPNYVPLSFINSFYRNVWFKWTAPTTGVLQVRTSNNAGSLGGVFDTSLTVFEQIADDGYAFLGDDDDSGFSRASAVTVSVIEGRVYYIAAGGWSDGVANQGSARLTLLMNGSGGGPGTIVPQFSDDLADALDISSKRFISQGSNTAASVELGEPNHAGGNGQRSVWFRFTAPYHGIFSVNTKDSTFDTVLAIYQGPSDAAIDQLTLVARNDNITGASRYSNIRGPRGMQGETYYIAVDGVAGASGTINIDFNFMPAGPAFVDRLGDQTVQQGDSAVFATDPITTDASILLGDEELDPGITYRWERQAAGSNSWSALVEDATYVGVDTPTLTVQGTVIGMNRDRFRLVVTDIHGTSTSSVATLYVTVFEPFVTRVGGVVDVDLTDGVPPAPGTKFYAKRLPKGLTLNSATGQISGVAGGKAKPGTYVVEYWSVGPDGRSDTLRLGIVIGEFLPRKSKPSYEALMVAQPSLLPYGRLTVKLTETGSYTALIEGVAGQKYSPRGTLTFGSGNLIVSSSAQYISRGSGQNRYRFILVYTPETNVMSATLEEVDAGNNTVATVATAGSVPEVRTSRTPAAWTGLYTVGMADPTDLGVNPAPEGAINAYGDVNSKTARLNLRGYLGDGTAFTTSLLSGTDASYRLFVRPKGGGGYLAGWIDLVARPQNPDTDPTGDPGLYHVTDIAAQDIYWQRNAGGTGPYSAGFGPVALRANLEPWRLSSSEAFRTGIYLGTYPTGNVGIVIRGAGLDNSGGNPDNLPTQGNLNLQNKFTVVGDNTAGLTLSLNNRTGAFTGSFKINDEGVIRTVAFKGVFIQQSGDDDSDVVARGVFNLPGASRKSLGEAGLIELTLPVLP